MSKNIELFNIINKHQLDNIHLFGLVNDVTLLREKINSDSEMINSLIKYINVQHDQLSLARNYIILQTNENEKLKNISYEALDLVDSLINSQQDLVVNMLEFNTNYSILYGAYLERRGKL